MGESDRGCGVSLPLSFFFFLPVFSSLHPRQESLAIRAGRLQHRLISRTNLNRFYNLLELSSGHLIVREFCASAADYIFIRNCINFGQRFDTMISHQLNRLFLIFEMFFFICSWLNWAAGGGKRTCLMSDFFRVRSHSGLMRLPSRSVITMVALFFIRTSNFGAAAEPSFIFLRFEAQNVLKMFFNLHGTQYFNK